MTEALHNVVTTLVSVSHVVQPPQEVAHSVQVGQGPAGVRGLPGPPDTSALTALETHEQSSLPHHAYDDIVSLTLLFENGLV